MSASEPLGTPAGVLASALVEALAADPAAISRLRELVAVDLPQPMAPEPRRSTPWHRWRPCST